MADTLTDEVIAEAMARAQKVACRPGDGRCYAFPDRLADAQETCTPKGRCKVGWIVSHGGRESWDIWLDLHTGEGRNCSRPSRSSTVDGGACSSQ